MAVWRTRGKISVLIYAVLCTRVGYSVTPTCYEQLLQLTVWFYAMPKAVDEWQLFVEQCPHT